MGYRIIETNLTEKVALELLRVFTRAGLNCEVLPQPEVGLYAIVEYLKDNQ